MAAVGSLVLGAQLEPIVPAVAWTPAGSFPGPWLLKETSCKGLERTTWEIDNRGRGQARQPKLHLTGQLRSSVWIGLCILSSHHLKSKNFMAYAYAYSVSYVKSQFYGVLRLYSVIVRRYVRSCAE